MAECPGEALQFAESGTAIKWDQSRCQRCDTCIKVCPADSNPHSQWLEVDLVLEKIRRSAAFLSGVTVSGGEATQQPEFVFELFKSIKNDSSLKHLSTMIDTNGSAERSTWNKLLPVTDGVMVDLKAFEDKVHKKLTGTGNAQVLLSIQYLLEVDKLFEVRLLIIPGWNDQEPMLQKTAEWLSQQSTNISIKILGFRQHGVRSEYPQLQQATPEVLEKVSSTFQNFPFKSIQLV